MLILLSWSRFLFRVIIVEYHAFTDDSLATMYFCVRGALAADDEFTALGAEPRFRVRETPMWKKHATDLEAEMLSRGLVFELIEWSQDH
jgi:hypothetical protein